MSVNKNRPHLYILPEDDDDNELANGFIDNLWVEDRQAQVLPVAGGWLPVLEKFKAVYISHLKKYDGGHIVLLIDFDEHHQTRFSRFQAEIPIELKDRVFVIGVWDEPQDLKKAFNYGKTFEEIGSDLADDCHTNTTTIWNHEHLKHNEPERLRLLNSVKSILFRP